MPLPRGTSEPETGGTLGDVGEFALIDQITTGIELAKSVRVGPGDDCAVLGLNGDLAVSTDTYVAGVHFRHEWSVAHQVGQRAVAGSVADLEAMGARPVALVMALAAPKDLSATWAKQCAQGLQLEAERAGVSLVGGDLTAASEVVLTSTVMGDMEGRAPVLRSGARPGQVVALRGRVGWSAAGLLVLTRGFRSPRAVVEAYQVPQVPYGAGAEAARAGATAMIDISDGLLADLSHIARASGVSLDVDTEALEIADPIRAVAAATGNDPLTFVLTGGEDHALAACFDPEAVPEGWQAIGQVVGAAEEPAVLVDGGEWSDPTGWTHFR